MPVMINQNRATFRFPLGQLGKSTELPSVSDNLTHLLRLDNNTFDPEGALRKRGGRKRLNASALASGGTVHTVFDAWQMGTAGTDGQFIMAYAGTQLYQSTDNGGSFSSVLTGLQNNAVGDFSVFDDIVIFASDDTADVPKSWDFSAAAFVDLAGTPPNFSFSVPHLNRQFAAGVAANPSTLYWSDDLNPEAWTGGNSGNASIDPNDGDRIVGMISHLDDLWIFKGPNIGSIHRIRNAFSISSVTREVVSRGIAPVAHKAIAVVGTDIFFVTREGLASLATTDKFGDIQQALPSRPVRQFFREINNIRLKNIQMVWYARGGLLAIAASSAGKTTNDIILVYDPVGRRWADPWELPTASLAVIVDSSGQKRLMSGDYSGFVNSEDSVNRSDDPSSTAYTWLMRTPALTFAVPGDPRFTPDSELTFHRISARIKPKGSYNISGTLKIDDQAEQAFTLDEGLGAQGLGSFTLGTDVLGPASFVEPSAFNLEGKGKTAIIQLSQGTADQDAEAYELVVGVESAGEADDTVS
jgi:hypothetical protein